MNIVRFDDNDLDGLTFMPFNKFTRLPAYATLINGRYLSAYFFEEAFEEGLLNERDLFAVNDWEGEGNKFDTVYIYSKKAEFTRSRLEDIVDWADENFDHTSPDEVSASKLGKYLSFWFD